MRMRKKKRKFKKNVLFLIIIVLLLIVGFLIYNKKLSSQRIKDELNKIKNHISDINSHYGEFVKVDNDSELYDKNGNIIGKVGKNIELMLDDTTIDKDTKYFKVKDFEDTYIKYDSVSKIDKLNDVSSRYKEYIPFNLNVVTKKTTSFYNELGELVYSFDKSYDLPIIIKDTDKYGVEFNNRLLYVKKDDVDKTYEHKNSDKRNASGIGVLNYHAFYDQDNASERAGCTSSICHSKKQFKTHLDYFKNHNMLTLQMKEVEMYVDGKLQLPKSVLITIDDGGLTTHAINMLTEYKMYATIFLVTSWYDPKDYPVTDYIELHSHSHHMHELGACPTGQGGAIQCWSEEKIQEDLKIAREKLNNTTYFCYPFYEYNDYSVRMLKQAGFTMAFDGEKSYGDNLVHPGDDKFRLRRFVIVDYTTLNDFDNYFGQIRA